MDTIKLTNKKDCKIVAHRGQCHLERENTVPAFIAAGNRSYFGIETDVHVTADRKLIIYHDDDTNRLTDVNVIIEESKFDDLRQLQIADKYGKGGRPDHRMPTLEEYISICKHYDKIGVLEIKNKMAPDDLDSIITAINEAEYLENIIFISFFIENLIYLRTKLPHQKMQFLLKKPATPEQLELMKKNKLDVDIYCDALTKDLVDAFHNEGMEVNVWTVNDREKAEKLIEWGVDYITTNTLE